VADEYENAVVVAAKLTVALGAAATFLAWRAGMPWLCPYLGGATCIGLISVGLKGGFDGGSRKLRRFHADPRAVEEGVTDNHGHARWMTMREALRAFPGPAPGYGGIVVGEAYRVDQDRVAGSPFNPRDRRTWGRGGRGELLVDPCQTGQTHSMLLAGSGGYKTVSAVSTVLHWTGSSVVLDPSCEVGPMVSETLRNKHRKAVHVLDPKRPNNAKHWGFNAVDWIDPRDPLAEMHVHTVVSWIFGENTGRETEEDLFFRKWGKDLVVCLLADLIWDDLPQAPRSLATLRVGVATPEKDMRDLLRSISRTSKNMMARHLAGSLMDIVPETFSGIYANANQGTAWLSVPAFADLVSGDAFRTSDLVTGPTTIFVQIPLEALMTTPGVCRVIVGALMNAVYREEGALNGRVLFLLDEVAHLGRMKVIEVARDVGRKYGITMHLCYQSVGQLEEQWGRAGKRAWYDAVSWRAYACVQDLETARELSAICGNRGVLAYSEGQNSGTQNRTGFAQASRSRGRNTNVHEISRPLIRPEEILQDMRADEAIVVPRGSRPIRCGRAIYFRRPELSSLVTASRFAQSVA
jgi:type IV secretion system protein VirD4